MAEPGTPAKTKLWVSEEIIVNKWKKAAKLLFLFFCLRYARRSVTVQKQLQGIELRREWGWLLCLGSKIMYPTY